MVWPHRTEQSIECDYCAEMILAGEQHVVIGEREEPWHLSCAASFGIPVEQESHLM